MKHKTQAQLKERRIKLAIDYIKILLSTGDIKGAIEVAEINGISPETFGKIVAKNQ